MSFKTIFIIFLIILATVLGFFGYRNFEQNIYSKEVLKLEILAPTEVELAQEVEYIVKYKNNGTVRLEEPKLTFEYPKYSLIEKGRFLRQEMVLDDIYPGEEKTFRFKARLLGGKNEAKVAKALLSYRPKNLEARYEAETSHTAIITTIPLNFEFDLPSKVEAGKEFSFRLNYFSNVAFPLSDLRAKIEYPSGFEFQKSSPQALDEIEWELGLLNKAEGGRIEIFGKQSGEVGEQKIFKAEIGLWQEGEFVLLKEIIRGIQLIKPAIYISQQINGSSNYIAGPGDLLHYEIFFKNIGEDILENSFVITRLEGKFFNFKTLKVQSGTFEPGDNSIVWDWRKVSKLQLLGPQEEGKVEFWVEVKDLGITGPQDKAPALKNKIYISNAWVEYTVKVSSRLAIEQKGYFQDEVFGNSGPIPPKAGETTTYTVIWQAKNSYNDVKDVKVAAILPQEVKLTGQIFPEDSRLTFDSLSREVIWVIGDMEAGRGILNPKPSVAFQIALTPSSNERKNFLLVGPATISGDDQFTETKLESITSAIIDTNIDTNLETGTGTNLENTTTTVM